MKITVLTEAIRCTKTQKRELKKSLKCLTKGVILQSMSKINNNPPMVKLKGKTMLVYQR